MASDMLPVGDSTLSVESPTTSTGEVEFKREDMLLQPTDPVLSWYPRPKEEKTSVHWGQRKLFLAELAFLNLFWDPQVVPAPHVVYPGAAPGTHIPLLAELYPQITWHLYDPHPFHIKPAAKIHLHRKLFTDKVAAEWTGRNDVLLISDIRAPEYTRAKTIKEEKMNEDRVKRDLRLQENWYLRVKPVQALLKFRLPYAYAHQDPTFRYLYGYVMKQAWAPSSSTETRLVPVGTDPVDWDIAKYGNQMFYQNAHVRENVKYANPYTPDPATPLDAPELLDDYDSRMEVQIWADYLNRTGTDNTLTNVQALSRWLTEEIGKGRLTLAKIRNRELPGPDQER